ncbi:MAG: 16S rRNA (cytidine(1402)-2'-O)-methyltransferase [Gammaproteobacteria bacterium]|nr:16S rRNA (cytidine(1402)-2'-O)-methyltransferase [Gammaproteobacteria bacterium]MCP4979661.1 16S rRNA (cytidine(1402)-2'-O)-methyltransferase [Gammaproteobacteria bacterium]
MTGVLYIVATPIGNLDDISLRAIATLKSVDLIAAEDTRHSKYLLNHLGIETRMISCHEHNEKSRSEQIIERLTAGSDVALISDAGTPLISDPGYRLALGAQQAGIRVSPIPGANSAITALCAAGLPTENFHFYGFLSSRNKELGSQLEALRAVHGTLVLFESSHRIKRLLQYLSDLFPQQQCVIAKELTKLHEQFLRGNAAQLLILMDQDSRLTRGEFVVLIDNSVDPSARQVDTEDADLLEILLEEVSVKIAVRIATRLTGKRKNELYQLALSMQKGKDSEISG